LHLSTRPRGLKPASGCGAGGAVEELSRRVR
jgi:hypothetical protein